MAEWIRTQDNALLEVESGSTITSSYDESIEHYTPKRGYVRILSICDDKPLLKATFERLCYGLVRNPDLDFSKIVKGEKDAPTKDEIPF